MKWHKELQLDGEQEAREKLVKLGQEHLFAGWEKLTDQQKENLLRQIERLDSSPLQAGPAPTPGHPLPLTQWSLRGSQKDQERGRHLLSHGRVATLVLAGGMSTRLQLEGPKGCFPVSVVKNKTLFRLLAEKVRAASQAYNYPLQIAIMTSPLNHVETETYFVQNGFFGLDPSQVHFFFQEMWPLLDLQSKLFLDEPGHISLGPNGNGCALRRLYTSGLWQQWKELGVEMVNLIQIDNPLADPFDAEFCGFHARQQSEVTVKGIFRTDPQENVGLLANVNDGITIIDYMEISAEEQEARDDGGFKYPVANIGLFCFSLPFIQKAAEYPLPVHRVKKTASMMNEEGETIVSKEPNVWKFEEFIFDVLPLSKKTEVLIYPRETTFGPLKNISGEASIERVQAALQGADRTVYTQISGVAPPPEACFELAQEFYYPTEKLIANWKGRPLPEKPYIEAK